MGKYQARICVDAILGKDVAARADLIGSPRVVFTDPQLAAVGKTLAAAEKDGVKARAVDVDTAANAGASFHGRNAPGKPSRATARLPNPRRTGRHAGNALHWYRYRRATSGRPAMRSLGVAAASHSAEIPRPPDRLERSPAKSTGDMPKVSSSSLAESCRSATGPPVSSMTRTLPGLP
jgi:hypothetical protein